MTTLVRTTTQTAVWLEIRFLRLFVTTGDAQTFSGNIYGSALAGGNPGSLVGYLPA
jgi:hypothetical protein